MKLVLSDITGELSTQLIDVMVQLCQSFHSFIKNIKEFVSIHNTGMSYLNSLAKIFIE